MTKTYDRILKLAKYDVFHLFGLAIIVWFVEQVISRMVETIVWGKHFVHWFDVAFTLALFSAFTACAAEMADRASATMNGQDLDRATRSDKGTNP